MKKPLWFSRVVSYILSVVIVLSLFIRVSAEASSVKLMICPTTYSSDRKAYVSTDQMQIGETMYLKVTTSQIDNLGGLSFTITYDMNSFRFSESNSLCYINQNSDLVSYHVNASKGYMQVTYDNASYESHSTVSGTIFYLAFTALDVVDTTNFTFVLNVKDLYDNSSDQRDIPVTTTDTCGIKIYTETISQDVINAFTALEHITYPESKVVIDSATNIYTNLTDKQQSLLFSKYPQQYEWLSTANTRYNRLAEQASQNKINDEIQKFKHDYSLILAKNVKTINYDDKSSIDSALIAYNNCSDAAKTYLQKEGNFLTSLNNRIEEIIDCKEEVNNFLSDDNFSIVWDKKILDNHFDVNYMQYTKYIQLALLCYDLLSDESKESVKPQYEWLCRLNDEVNKYLELDKKSAELAKKISDFQQAYIYVFTLSENNVSVQDKSAIQMVIDAYNKLTDKELKAELKEKIDKLSELLKLADELSEDNSNVTVLPVDKTQDNSKINSEISNGKTITNTIEKLIGGKTVYSTAVLYLLLLLALSVSILIVTYILCQLYKKKINISEESEENADEYAES